jgi:hypothetical protein
MVTTVGPVRPRAHAFAKYAKIVGTTTKNPTTSHPRAAQCIAPETSEAPPSGASINAPHVKSHVTRVVAPTRSITGFESTM